MSDSDALVCFAYGEDLEALTQRSLGFRLLTPCEPEPSCAEMEALARALQTCPYPEHWPARDLFCSVLLADGRRLVGLVRYGLADHTPGQRRGGLEMIGVLAPPSLDAPSALALDRWLRQRRHETDDLRQLAGIVSLSAVLASTPPALPPSDPLPVLPVRLWQEGALLFAATTPADPDHQLRLLEQNPGPTWQWLPLVGPDFPLAPYLCRGPLIAWTPHLAGVALKLDPRGPTSPSRPSPSARLPRALVALLLLLIGLLLAANLWYLRDLRTHVHSLSSTSTTPASPSSTAKPASLPPDPAPPSQLDRKRFAAALHEVLLEQGAREWDAEPDLLLDHYNRLLRRHHDLRLPDQDSEGKRTVAILSLLAGRNADRIEEMVRKALTGKGFSDHVIRAACAHVRDELAAQHDPAGRSAASSLSGGHARGK